MNPKDSILALHESICAEQRLKENLEKALKTHNEGSPNPLMLITKREYRALKENKQ